jgi:hypothetical protein
MWFDDDDHPCGGPRCNERFEARGAYIEDVLVIHDANGLHRFSPSKR